MNMYDEKFKQNIRDILTKGTRYKSRAKWEDGTNAECIKLFGLVNEYDLSDLSNVPVGTLRRFPYKNSIDEILWIWQKKSNKISDLNSHIWDSWADINGSIGAAYGFQVASKLRKVMVETETQDGSHTVSPAFLDQIDFIRYSLKHDPFSRRMVTDLYSVDQTGIMGLDPCCYGCTWNVTLDEKENKVLNLLLNQRSQDMVVANNWNVFQYSILLYMLANEAGMKPGKLVHVIADAHIYDRHIEIAEELLKRESFDSPTLVINHHDNFYDYKLEDFKLEDYVCGEQIKNIPVAV